MKTKKELRAHFKQCRTELSEIERQQAAVEVANLLKKLINPDWKFIHIYLPIERLNELDTEAIVGLLWGMDKEIVVSCSDFTTMTMSHYLLEENTMLKTNEFGVPEPLHANPIAARSLDAVIIPLLACDKKGYRLGYGKGFYDRFLASCPKAARIGIGFFDLIEEVPEVHPNDIAMDYYIYPKGITTFSS